MTKTEEILKDIRERLDCAENIGFQNVEWLVITLESELKLSAQMREALAYYSHHDHYDGSFTLGGLRQPGVLTEGGQKAREAIELYDHARGGE